MKVALVGFAPNTLDYVKVTDADEIWSIVWAYNYKQLPRIDRLFEMHPIWFTGASKKREYLKPREHYLWLQTNKRIPVYMQEARPEIPRSIAYPLDQVSDALLSGWMRSGERGRMFTSSVDYMMALAIYEGATEIEILGIEMSSESEFKFQREGYAFWHGLALGAGVRMTQHKPTELLYKPKRYGYDEVQMIGRQDLERLKNEYLGQQQTALARLQFHEGQLDTAIETLHNYRGNDEELRERLRDKTDSKKQLVDDYVKQVAIASGALQTVEYLIKEIDLEEPDPQLNNPFANILVHNVNGGQDAI